MADGSRSPNFEKGHYKKHRTRSHSLGFKTTNFSELELKNK